MLLPMEGNRISIKEFIKTGQILYSALTIGQLVFLLVAIYMVQFAEVRFNVTDLNELYLYAALVITVICLTFGFIFYNKKLEALKGKSNLYEKLAEYRSAQIIRWALFEGPSFFSIVTFILTSNYLFLCFVGVILGAFVLTMPSRAKFDNELNLSWEEKKQLSD